MYAKPELVLNPRADLQRLRGPRKRARFPVLRLPQPVRLGSYCNAKCRWAERRVIRLRPDWLQAETIVCGRRIFLRRAIRLSNRKPAWNQSLSSVFSRVRDRHVISILDSAPGQLLDAAPENLRRPWRSRLAAVCARPWF